MGRWKRVFDLKDIAIWNSNLEVLQRIRKNYLLTNTPRKIKIPSGINFSITDETVNMKLTSNAVTSNMQSDESAFEGWALVLKRWGNFKNVIISWDGPGSISNKHYQRFLFRLKHFSEDFNSWFSVDQTCKLLINDLRIKQKGKYVLNVPGKREEKVAKYPEAELENLFVNKDLREALMNISDAITLYRQLPVGVFENSVSKSSSIFTGGKSAIDIWGFNKYNELLVFELKADNNVKVGIISELYFYVCVLQMVRKQIFKHENCPNELKYLLEIPGTIGIKAYFLTPMLHPLIDKEIFNLLNSVSPDEITYHFIQFNKESQLTLDKFL